MFSNYLRGVVEYRIELDNPEGFVNFLKKDIPIIKLDIPDKKTVNIKCFPISCIKVEMAAEKKKGVVISKKIKGLPVYTEALKKRFGLVVGCLLFVLSVYVSSLFVWEIRVEGNENLSCNEVVEMLSEVGFYEGVLKKKTDVKDVADSVLINEDAVSWIAINFDGTVAHVEIKEALPAVPVPKKQNVNLVSSANGIILRVDAHEGGTVVNKGDVVVKGQLLVSAFVDKRTGGSMLRGARGFVWAKTDRKIRVEVPLEYERKEWTEKEKKEYSVSFLGTELSLKSPFSKKGKLYDRKEEVSELQFGKNIVLPITVKTVTKKEYIQYKSRRTVKQALETARLAAKERLYEISPLFALAETQEEFCEQEGKLVYTCTFSGVENVAQELEFELS